MNGSNTLQRLLVVASWLPALAFAGSISGKVVLGGTAPAPRKVEVTIDQYLCGKDKDAQDLVVSPRREVANAVVWLENPPPAAWPSTESKATIDQNGCLFV